MARKVFISVLGSTNYFQCDYQRNDISYGNVRFIQEATINYLDCKNKWTENDHGYILLTKGAFESNWVDDGIDPRTGNPKENIKGLKSTIEDMNLSFQIEPIPDLPDGNNESEIWTIFERVFEKIQDGDELYFDMTHGFRYIPMLVLVLVNYSKFLKHINVASITYGNYEVARQLQYGLIVDLLPLSQLQDWTYAAGQYLESGNARRLVELSNNKIKPILKETQGNDGSARELREFVNSLQIVVDERTTCRGMDIIKSENLKRLKISANNIESSIIKPLNPIIEKIRKSLVYFDELENAKNGFSAAKWCFDNGMFQQTATILQEFVVTFFCKKHNIKIDDESKREIVNQAFILKYNHQDVEIGDNWGRVKEENKCKLKEILEDDLFDNKDLIKYFNNLTEVRNDFNHSGMRSSRPPQTPKTLRDNIEKCLSGFAMILFNIKF